MSSDLGSGEMGDGGMSLLSIFATWGVPFALSLAAATYSLLPHGLVSHATRRAPRHLLYE